jgi:hypothetical protein
MGRTAGVFKLDNCVGQGACHLHGCTKHCSNNDLGVVYVFFSACGPHLCNGAPFQTLSKGPACGASMSLGNCHSLVNGQLWECLGSSMSGHSNVCIGNTETVIGSVNTPMFTALCGGCNPLTIGLGSAEWSW